MLGRSNDGADLSSQHGPGKPDKQSRQATATGLGTADRHPPTQTVAPAQVAFWDNLHPPENTTGCGCSSQVHTPVSPNCATKAALCLIPCVSLASAVAFRHCFSTII